jgi:hypothetical protein
MTLARHKIYHVVLKYGIEILFCMELAARFSCGSNGMCIGKCDARPDGQICVTDFMTGSQVYRLLLLCAGDGLLKIIAYIKTR